MSAQNNADFPSTHETEDDFINYLEEESLKLLDQPKTTEKLEFDVDHFTIQPGKHKTFKVAYDENGYETTKVLIYNTGEKRMKGEAIDFSGDGVHDHILMTKGNYKDFVAFEIQGGTNDLYKYGFDNYEVDTITGFNKKGEDAVKGFWLDDYGDSDPRYDQHGLPKSISIGWIDTKWNEIRSRVNEYRKEFPMNFEETPTRLVKPEFVDSPYGRITENNLQTQGVEGHELVFPTSSNVIH